MGYEQNFSQYKLTQITMTKDMKILKSDFKVLTLISQNVPNIVH